MLQQQVGKRGHLVLSAHIMSVYQAESMVQPA